MQNVIKRFSREFKKPRRKLMDPLYDRVKGTFYPYKVSDRPFTIHVVYHWFYNYTPNTVLDREFYNLLKEIDPESLKEENVFEEDTHEIKQ